MLIATRSGFTSSFCFSSFILISHRSLNRIFTPFNVLRANHHKVNLNYQHNHSTSINIKSSNNCTYQHIYTSYKSMIEHEKEESKKYILIEDRTMKLKVNDKSNLETIIDSPITNYWDYWIKDKHYLLVNLSDPDSFSLKSQSILFDAKFPIQSKNFYITKLPGGIEGSSGLKGIPKDRHDLRLYRQSVKSADNLQTNDSLEKGIKNFIYNLTQNELECKLKFFVINSFEELLCQGVFEAFQLTPFGSSVNSLGWGSSGLDLCLTTKYLPDPSSALVASSGGLLDGSSKRQRCIKMYSTLMKTDLIPSVNNANQPNNQTVKLFSNFTSTDFTITCTDPTTMELFKLTEILFQIARSDERVMQLIHFCKLWAEVHGCISPTFNNLLLTMLIINYLQVKRPFPILPPLEPFFQSDEINFEPNQVQDQSSSFVDLLQGFFRHVGTFDFPHSGANLFQGKIIRKPTRDAMFILDPARSTNMATKVTKNDLDNLLRVALKSYKLMGSGCSLQTLLKPITQEIYRKTIPITR